MTTITELDRALAELIFLGTKRRVPLKIAASTIQASLKETRRAVSHLTELGYPLHLSPADFVERLRFRPIDAQLLKADLTTARIGRKLEWRLHVHSTQDELKRLEHEADDGTVLLAETQDSGRGRTGRHWLSPYGGIWMSVLLRPTWPSSHQILTLAFAAAVARAVSASAKISLMIKWPNDLIVGSRKVAGTLAEGSYQGKKLERLVVGIGLNANIDMTRFPETLRRTSTSLSHELGRQIDRTMLARRMIEELDRSYCRFESGHASGLLDEAKRLCSTLGRKVRVRTAGALLEGEAMDLRHDGQLLVRLSDGAIVSFCAGEVVHVR